LFRLNKEDEFIASVRTSINTEQWRLVMFYERMRIRSELVEMVEMVTKEGVLLELGLMSG
jgi:hypothetical protein